MVSLSQTLPIIFCLENFVCFLAHLSHRLARAVYKKYLITTSPLEPLVQIQNKCTAMFLKMPSAKIALNGSAPSNKTAARALDKIYPRTTSPEPLVQIQNNFTEMFIMMPSAKITQTVLLCRTRGVPEL